MQNYIDQLVEDIKNARNKPRPPKMGLPPELEFVRGAEEFLHGKLYAMGHLFGFEKMQFPPIERLNPRQVKLLVNGLEELWEAFNFCPDFPEGLPDAIKYKLLVDYLDYETTYITYGENHIEFCSYMPDECPFPPEYCRCRDIITGFDSNVIDFNKNTDQPF